MKQKKQIKIIISLLVMIAVLLGSWGLLRTNGLKAEERTKRTVVSSNVEVISLPGEGPFPLISSYAGVWQDSLTASIPNTDSFSMLWSPNNELIFCVFE